MAYATPKDSYFKIIFNWFKEKFYDSFSLTICLEDFKETLFRDNDMFIFISNGQKTVCKKILLGDLILQKISCDIRRKQNQMKNIFFLWSKKYSMNLIISHLFLSLFNKLCVNLLKYYNLLFSQSWSFSWCQLFAILF